MQKENIFIEWFMAAAYRFRVGKPLETLPSGSGGPGRGGLGLRKVWEGA